MNRVIFVSQGGKTTGTTYDANGNQLTATDWLGNTITNVFDPLNRLVEKRDANDLPQETYFYDESSRQIAAEDVYGRRTTYEYDRNSRLIRTTAPDGYTIAQTYDRRGNVITQTDALGNTTHYAYDYLGRLVSVTDALDQATTYTYDLKGNLLSQTDDLGNMTYLEYNCRDLLLRKVSPGGRTGEPGAYTYDPTAVISYTCDAFGNTATRTDRNGNTTVFEWDVHGNLVSQAIGTTEISYTYDNNGNVLTTTDSLGTTTRVYDEFNRCVSKTVPFIGTSVYAYDITSGLPAGHVAETTTDPKGNVTLREYDRTGRMVRVTDTAADLTTHTVIYTYNDNGSVASVLYPDGAREDYTYTVGNLLETLTNTLSDGTVLETYVYTYDLARNLLIKQDAKGTTAYTYDPLGRVFTVTEPSGKLTEYTYDGSGNRSTQTVTETQEDETVTVVRTTYTYDARNRLTSLQKHDISDLSVDPILLDVTDYTYDHSGNQLTTTRTTYTDGVAGTPVMVQSNTYDVWNQLVRTETENGTVVENAYNGDGRRVIKTVNGASTYYLYEYDKVILETNVYGDVTGRNVYGLNLLIRTVGVDTFYYMYNGHADVTALLTPSGTVAASYYYDAFGNILEQTGDVSNSILFAGYQYDKETGLYYLNARMYDPVTARFMQEDTYAGQQSDPLSLNLYTYCHNSPLLYFDPTGHYTEYSYETRGYYEYHGYLLSMDSANDNLAEREMREAMWKEFPGKTASSPADLAMINAGYGDAFKHPTMVYKEVKVAREVKADNTNSRTIQDYEYQMQMQARADTKNDDDSIENLLSQNYAGVPLDQQTLYDLFVWVDETRINYYGGTIQINALQSNREKYPTDAKMLTALSMITNTADYTNLGSILDHLQYMLPEDAEFDGYSIGEKQMEGLGQIGLHVQSCAAERAYVFSSWDRFFSMLAGSGIGIFYAVSGKFMYDMAGQIEENICGTDNLSTFFDNGYNGLTDWIIQGTQQYGVDGRALYDGVSVGEAIGTTAFMMDAASLASSRFAEFQKANLYKSTTKPGTLSTEEARQWYLEQESNIPNMINKKLSLEQQAQQAFILRNQIRTQARNLMADRVIAERLFETSPNMTWNQVVSKYTAQGYAGDGLYREIISASQRSNPAVNQSLGIFPTNPYMTGNQNISMYTAQGFLGMRYALMHEEDR